MIQVSRAMAIFDYLTDELYHYSITHSNIDV